jgi:hypothetical protein
MAMDVVLPLLCCSLKREMDWTLMPVFCSVALFVL